MSSWRPCSAAARPRPCHAPCLAERAGESPSFIHSPLCLPCCPRCSRCPSPRPAAAGARLPRMAAVTAAVARGREATGHHRPSCDHRCVCQVTAVLVNPSGSSQLSPPRRSTDAGEHLLLEPPVRVARPFRAISDQAWQPYACAPVP
jgi:hypothetical protein